MKKGLFFILLLTALYVSIPFSSASIVLPTFNEGYSLGDDFVVKISIERESAFEGYLKLNLECDNSSNNFFLLPIALKAESSKNIDIPPITLTKTGRCSVHAVIENQNNNKIEEQRSNNFIISDFIEVSIVTNKEIYKPGEKIKIEGTAISYNKKEVDGEALISIDNSYHVKVTRGKFLLDDVLYEKMGSGNHTVKVMVDDGKGNFGDVKKEITILVIPTSIEVSLNKTVFNPGENIEATAVLLDQAGETIDSEIILTLYDSWGAEIKRESTNDGIFEYAGKNSDVSGNWWIYAYSSNLKTRKFLYINEIKSIDIKIDGNILNVTNIGNVGYNGPVVLKFKESDNSESKTLNINLGVGQSKLFTLSGDGSYKIEIRSNEFSKELGASLTGGTVGVDNIESPWRKIIAITFILILIIAAGIFEFKRERKIKIKEMTVNASKI